MDNDSRAMVAWLRGETDTQAGRGSVKLSTDALARCRRYKANTGKPRLARARRQGNKVVFGAGIDLQTAMGTRYSFVPRVPNA